MNVPDESASAAADLASHEAPTLALLCIAMLVGVFAFIEVYSVQSILPILVQDFQATPIAAGATVGATVLAVALTSPFMGMVSDAFGRKSILVGAIFFLALPTWLIAYAHSIPEIVLYRFLQGLAIPGITVVMIAYVGEEFRGRAMTRLMSIYIAGTVLGGFLGRFLVGHLSEWFDWRTAFQIMAAINLAGALLIWKTLPASRHFVGNPHFRSALRTLWQHLHNPQLHMACALGACVLFSLVGGFTYVNLYLAEPPFSLSSAGLANIFTIYLIGVLITPLSSRLITRLGFSRTIVVAVSCSVLGVMLTLVPDTVVILIALTILSCGVFITQAATTSFIATHIATGRSLASGLYYMSYYTGGTVGAALCGYAYTHYGWPGTVAAIVLAQTAAITIAALLMERKGGA